MNESGAWSEQMQDRTNMTMEDYCPPHRFHPHIFENISLVSYKWTFLTLCWLISKCFVVKHIDDSDWKTHLFKSATYNCTIQLLTPVDMFHNNILRIVNTHFLHATVMSCEYVELIFDQFCHIMC